MGAGKDIIPSWGNPTISCFRMRHSRDEGERALSAGKTESRPMIYLPEGDFISRRYFETLRSLREKELPVDHLYLQENTGQIPRYSPYLKEEGSGQDYPSDPWRKTGAKCMRILLISYDSYRYDGGRTSGKLIKVAEELGESNLHHFMEKK